MSVVLIVIVAVSVIFSSFLMSASRLLNCFLIVEQLSLLLVVVTSFLQVGGVFISVMLICTVDSTMSLVILYRLWDSSGLGDGVGR